MSRVLRFGKLGCAAVALLAAHVARAVPPGEVSGLAWCGGSKACLQWNPAPAADSYTVYRGDPADLPALENGGVDSALAGRWPATTTGEMLVAVPPSGSFFWYLVTASSAAEEGPAGDNTAGPRDVDASGGSCGDLAYLESFDVPEASPWPAPWTPIGSVAVSDVELGRARSRPTVSFYSLARLHAPLPVEASDVEALFSLEFEDVATQGVGFYVRQNGGYLQQSATHGQGYAVFVEGFRSSPGIGVWKEEDGQEISLDIRFDPALDFQNGVRYRVRFRVRQSALGSTLLQAKVWREIDPEPLAWDVQFTDSTGVLQGIAGGLAADSWSSITPATPGSPSPPDTFIDDVRVMRICGP